MQEKPRPPPPTSAHILREAEEAIWGEAAGVCTEPACLGPGSRHLLPMAPGSAASSRMEGEGHPED